MIELSFPDGKIKAYESPLTGFQVAETISPDFARNCIAMRLNDQLMDLHNTIEDSAAIQFITTRDSEAMDIMRHSAAHVMAQAVLHLFPDAKLTIGPTVDDGFYYDIDMAPVSKDDFPKIEAEMKKIVKARFPFHRKLISKSEALSYFKNEPYKLELIEDLEDGEISLYEQGSFTDLCRGPHVPHTGFIRAFKLLKVSGAYWRADQNNEQLQRIYGTAFFDKKELKDYLHFLEEAKKRNHRKIGTALDLYSFHEEAPGMAFFHPKGMVIWNELLEYWRYEHRKAGYVETKTPIMLNRSLWERSGHWDNYRENMYVSTIDDVDYSIKPMNCPGGMLLFGMKPHSYRELPLRVGEIGLVHRHELSGVLNGLFRVRAFHQDDAHIFMTEDQISDEILGVIHLVEKIYSTFGLTFQLELSTRPDKSIGTDEDWDKTTQGLKKALEIYGKPYRINEGDGAFYGPKIDIHIKDALKRTWQCGTIQLDMSLPERFDLTYIEPNNERKRPIMIHRVIYGSIERFLGILVEHYAGKFPLWMAPVQVILMSLNDELIPFTKTIQDKLLENNIRTEIDGRSENLKKKVRDAQLNQISLIVTLGNKEKENNSVSVRRLDGHVAYGIPLEQFIKTVCNHIQERKLEMDLFQ
ncbi:MAG: Threonyl-tRNA synthetase [Candidatus Magnetoglobus multicellularis str. Araruama]|uniref:Threonine--tRNA ligase n=1 Tax=Candidatus Magnetoglobus multicellularis str. Araruama TaxID=890399 RepID=A0A1V1PE34_9BACT|nr:MAG: Threonyl-tRNA synthetase [Candidatus Magnetoglobus multicellularis str. Araruama]